MFSGTGHHIHGGIFYNIGGDVNLQTHLTIQHEADFQPLASSTLGLGDGQAEGSRRRLSIQDQETCEASLHPSSSLILAHDDRFAGSERDWVGVARNPRYNMAARRAPYDMASRPRHSKISANNEVPSGLSSSQSSGLSESSSVSFPERPSSPMLYSQSLYPITYPHFTGDHITRPDENQYSYSNSEAAGTVHPYLELFDSGPATSNHGGTFITARNVNIYGTKRGQEHDISTRPFDKRRRREDGLKIIQTEHLKLIREIGSGPGYFLHVGQNEGHAVIVKVFNRGPTLRQQLESTVTLSRGLIHPNVLRIEGISSPASLVHFIAYEDGKSLKLVLSAQKRRGFPSVHWENTEGPLAVALKNDLARSITLGFRMVAGLSAGINHLCVQGVSLGSIGVESFDVFLDLDDRFLISINPRSPETADTAEFQESDDKSWGVFNALCQKVLISANRVLHDEPINRDPVPLDLLRPTFVFSMASPTLPSSLLPFRSATSQKNQPEAPPRREYIWRTMDRGLQSLATVARQMGVDPDMNLSPLHRLTRSDGQSPHRCAGYVREEITLATTMLDSAVVAHDAPTPLEICSICHEVVALHEVFDCICGDPAPGSRPTVKCQVSRNQDDGEKTILIVNPPSIHKGKRAFGGPDERHTDGGREYGYDEYGSESRPASRWLSVMELCHDTDADAHHHAHADADEQQQPRPMAITFVSLLRGGSAERERERPTMTNGLVSRASALVLNDRDQRFEYAAHEQQPQPRHAFGGGGSRSRAGKAAAPAAGAASDVFGDAARGGGGGLREQGEPGMLPMQGLKDLLRSLRGGEEEEEGAEERRARERREMSEAFDPDEAVWQEFLKSVGVEGVPAADGGGGGDAMDAPGERERESSLSFALGV
ncbi:hypothetical protein C8J57DRAFT_1729919 [Mycena rebaudengoi]|nr:hypothetical protein C8J57DRAFT_1729919 [Mycena rebaudengoi]